MALLFPSLGKFWKSQEGPIDMHTFLILQKKEKSLITKAHYNSIELINNT